MKQVPLICPACGELLIARTDDDDTFLIIDAHPDRVTPWTVCVPAMSLIDPQ